MSRERGQLLGRDREVAALREVLDDAIAGRSRFVLVTGEAGIGKSRLLEEVAEMARAANCLTLTGRAAEFESDLPFAGIIDALDPYLRTLDDHDVERLWVDRLGALAAVFPALEGLGPAVDIPVNAGERFRVHRAVAELIERLAARRPVLLVLDDLQWADAASLELAAHLTRRPPDGAVMIAFGVRSGSMPERATRSLASIETAGNVRNLVVPPLGPRAIGELVGLSTDAADRLHHLTRGNPFYALQLAQSDVGLAGDLQLADVPEAVRRAIRVEFDALPPIAREVADAAAVVGDPFDLDLTVGATDVAEEAVLEGLDHLCLCGIVRPAGSPRSFEFRHPLVRSAIYQATPPGTRITRHRRITAHLQARGAGPVELAHHVEHSARHGDMAAVEVLARAAEAVTAQAPASAVRWLETALSLLPVSEPPRQRIRLLGDLAMAHAGVGDLQSGLDALRLSLSTVEPGDHRARASVAIACAEGERLLGRPEVAEATLRTAFEELDDRESPQAAMLAVARSTNAFYLGAYDETLSWASEAEGLATRLDDTALLVAACAARTAGAALSGRIALSRELHARVKPLLETLDDGELAHQLDMLGGLASAELYLDLYDDAAVHADRGLRIARQSGQIHLVPVFTPVAGTAAWMIGNLEAAAEIIDDAIEAARLVDNDSVLAWHLFNRALPLVVYGDVEAGRRFSDESWALAEPLGESLIRGYSAAVQGYVLLEAGRPAEAIELLHRAAGGPGLTLIGGAWRGIWYEVLTRCHLELGDTSAALATVRRTRALAEEVPVDLAAMSAERSEALTTMAADEPYGAVELARSALARAETMRSPIWVASCNELVGRTLAVNGDDQAAAIAFDAASAGYDKLGSHRLRDRVDGELRQLGRTIHRRTRPGHRHGSGLAALTGRELEVAELIRAHSTNREIAGELFLSLKTVETHVRHIFDKLGVSSRADIARTLEAAADSP